MLPKLLVINLFIINCFCTPITITKRDGDQSKCGYDSCHPVNSKQSINIHMIPHSHDDVGWIKTVDQYYYGTYRNKQFAGIQYTIGSVLESLYANPDRRFSQVESAYLTKWWKHQDERTRKIYVDLVRNGQLEIVNGAWSMNDEAVTHYQSIIDQFSLGLRFINETFGSCGRPKIGWQIDPFGHSNEMATIFAQLGYDALMFSRLDYRDRQKRLNLENMEFVWQGSPSLGSKSQIFTSIMYDSYSTPQKFCYDVLCNVTEPIVDDPDSPEYNLKAKVDEFVNVAKYQSKYYKTSNLLFPFGGDFTYQSAHTYYVNIEKLMKGVKMFYPDISVIYSTPSCYIKAVNDMQKNQLSVNTNDFLPYASESHAYWTGYYTSRPNFKRLERMGNNLLQTTKQLIAFEKIKTKKDFSNNLDSLRESMGISQHHDAITGTEKQLVSQDYTRLLTRGMKKAEGNMTTTIFDLLVKDGQDASKVKVELASCLLANLTHCEPSKQDQFLITVYNPLSRSVSHHVRLPVNGNNFIINGTSSNITYDVVTLNNTFIVDANVKPSRTELVFKADNIPPHGIKMFYVQKNKGSYRQKAAKDAYYYGDQLNGFRIDNVTKLLSEVTLNGTKIKLSQSLYYYQSSTSSPRSSGAYIFRPSNQYVMPFGTPTKVTSFRGQLVDEYYQEFTKEITQTIRIYKNESHIEFDWMVGPLDLELNKGSGIEVVSIFNTSMKTSGLFYTDSNGREMIERKFNYRSTYNYTNEEPVASNFYPVTSRIMLRDKEKNLDLAVVTDRAQGGSSLQDGQIQLMLHRRLSKDDGFGVDEALNEQEYGKGVVARGTHYLTFGSTTAKKGEKSSVAVQRDLMQRKHLAPWVFIGAAPSLTLAMAKKIFNFEYAALKSNLSENVNLLTFEPWNNDGYLIRLEHVFANDEDPILAKPIDVDLNNLFADMQVTKFRETTIDGSQWLDDNKKLNWPHTNRQVKATKKPKEVVTLNPMEIRTFIIEATYKKKYRGANGAASSVFSRLPIVGYLAFIALIARI